ncbi:MULTISPECIES: hypothetical protein [Chryseobacterium]|uniref:Uncharacterized protein n=2 Tax=Chryseobacterium TaxID=59732 RepID=A0A3G6MWM0_9FLAO|nr:MULTISPECIES: hypothetical protein [Chryseobacterium]AZA60230.1 hypothetical protein EG340_03895 [Chryseobacterium indoltheticum]SFZ93100.1 hypothetical protein SAMN05216324_104125 [Chryseobacterium limigenitum]
MSISYYDFNNLPKESQIELVMAEGKIIDETIKNNLRFVVYELSSFSVEIVYNIDSNKIAGLSAFPGNGVHGK